LQAAVDAANDGETVQLLTDVLQNSEVCINKNITLDLNGKKIYNTTDIWADSVVALVNVKNNANVTITGNGVITAKENDCYAINLVSGTLTIENGNIVGNVSAVQVQTGHLYIKGGTFSLLQKWNNKRTYLINMIDAAYKDGSARVTITGGTFVDYEPSQSTSEHPTANFVPTGYKVTRDGDNYVVTVKSDNVAEIGDIQYATLADAVAAANNGETVTLLTNTAEDITIAQGKDITLDLNGKQLTNVNSHTIFNKGTLTINGNNGTVDNVTNGTAAVYNDVTGNVTINGGSYTRSAEASTSENNSGGNSWYVIHNYGIMNINKGTFKFSDTNVGAFSSLIHNGWYDGSKNTAQKNAVMTINGGVFTQPQSDYYCIFNWDIAKISGGTINGYVGNAYGNETCDKGDLTISDNAVVNGGVQSATAAGKDSSDTQNLIKITDNAKVAGAITSADAKYVSVSGGYFTVDPTTYCAEGKTGVASGDKKYPFTVGDIVNNVKVVPSGSTASAGDMDGKSDVEVIQEAINASRNHSRIILKKGNYSIDAPIYMYGGNHADKLSGEQATDRPILKFSNKGIITSRSSSSDSQMYHSLYFENIGMELRPQLCIEAASIYFDNAYSRLDVTTAQSLGSTPIKSSGLFKMKNGSSIDFWIRSSSSYICYCGIDCTKIEIDDSSISLQNECPSSQSVSGDDLNFIYNTNVTGYIRNSKLTGQGNGRTNFINGKVTIDECDITLKNRNHSLCHYTTNTEQKLCSLRDCTINYTASTYLTFGKIEGCFFINTVTGVNSSENYKLQILCPTQMIGNTFIGRSEMNFNSNKVQFIGNAMQYSQSYTSFPTGSVNTGTMITG